VNVVLLTSLFTVNVVLISLYTVNVVLLTSLVTVNVVLKRMLYL